MRGHLAINTPWLHFFCCFLGCRAFFFLRLFWRLGRVGGLAVDGVLRGCITLAGFMIDEVAILCLSFE